MNDIKGDKVKRYQIAFTLGTCSPCKFNKNAHVLCFKEEKNLLLAVGFFFRICDMNFLTGYNTDNFDNWYLFSRTWGLGIEKQFSNYGKIKKRLVQIKKEQFESKAYGKTEMWRHICPGIISMDLITVLRRDPGERLGSYTLNNVSEKILGDRKDDVHYSEMKRLCCDSGGDGRRIVLEYCMKDALLPMRIILFKKYHLRQILTSRITRTLMKNLIEKGQQEKVKGSLLSEIKKLGFIMPTLTDDEKSRRHYEGAFVHWPRTGYYDKVPVITVDFKSLYPSIIIGMNLCYSTKISKSEAEEYDRIAQKEGKKSSWYYNKSPSGHFFVTVNIRKGILPIILKRILKQRAKVKKEMKIAKNEGRMSDFDRLNGEQMALKIFANSTYGFLGAFFYPDRDIAESITLYGQKLIKFVRKLIEEHFTINNGYPRDAQVVYGDTDSIMIILADNLKESFKIGKEAADYVTKKIGIDAIILDLEEVYQYFIMITKKKYAAIKFENINKISEKDGKLISKGIASKRRDTFLLVRNLIKDVINILVERKSIPIDFEGIEHFKGFKHVVQTKMKEDNKLSIISNYKDIYDVNKSLGIPNVKNLPLTLQYAIHICRKKVYEILLGEVRFHEIILSKGLKKPPDEYKTINKNGGRISLPPHVSLVKRQAKKDPGSEPKSGDRVMYVIVKRPKIVLKNSFKIKNKKKLLKNQQSENPQVALKERCEIDYEYISESTIKTMSRIFSSLIISPETFSHIDFEKWDRKKIKKEMKKQLDKNRKLTEKLVFGPVLLNIRKTKKTNYHGPMDRFVKSYPRCLNCNWSIIRKKNNKRRKLNSGQIEITSKNKGVCNKCNTKEIKSKVLKKLLKINQSLKIEDQSLKIQCKLCQGDNYGIVKCCNTECPHFYIRDEIPLDIEDLSKKINRICHDSNSLQKKKDTTDDNVNMAMKQWHI